MASPDIRSPLNALARLRFFLRLQRTLAKTQSEIEVWDVAIGMADTAHEEHRSLTNHRR